MKITLKEERYCLFFKMLIFMKLILFIICFTAAQAGAVVYGQTISLKIEKENLEEALIKISKQSKYDLVYDSKLLKNIKSRGIDLKDVSVQEALNELFYNHPLTYKLSKNAIVVTAKEQRLDSNQPAKQFAQLREISGTVKDSVGNLLQGVSVVVKSQPTIGTTTDVNGKFILDVPANAVLVFRYVGFLTNEVQVAEERSIDVLLAVDNTGLEEVVIVGFGKQKKESLVSSVATIKGEQLRMPNRSLSNNLAGQIPGLIAVQRSGEPGYDNSEFWIRGVSSFAGGTSPLVLVDGIPRNMNDIEPDEIETFTLLKDASATAIYGAEGANGVVLITSKRGRVQKTAIAYRGEYSISSPTRVPQFASSVDYLSLYNEALRNEGKAPAFSDEVLDKYASGEDPDLYPNSNWWDILMSDHTDNMRHTLNFRGGGDRMRFFVSGAYFQEAGLYKVNNEYNNNAGLKRYNLRSNIDIDVTSTTLLRVDLSGQYLQANFPRNSATNIFERFSRIPPHLIPPIYSDGTLAAHPSQDNNKVNPYNQLMEYGYAKEWRSGIQSRIDLEQKLDVITQGLKVRGAISYDANSTYNMNRAKTPATYFATGRDDEGNLIFNQITNEVPFGDPSESNSGDKKIYMEAAVDYARTFDQHALGAMFLMYQKERQVHNDALAYRKQAFIGRTNYTFDNRYTIEANFGITGSENFAEGYRYGFFPAVGVSWNVTNEPYFPESLKTAISSLKLRGSIGRTGNDNTTDTRFMYRPQFATSTGYNLGIGSTGALNNLGGLIEGRFASPFLSWEIELKRNYGIDLSLWGNLVNIQADYFSNHRTDILLQRRTLSSVAGFRQSPWQNFGQVKNKGVDGSLNINHHIGEVSVSLRGNFTYARNKIIEYDEVPQVHPWMNITGTRLNALNGVLIADGLFTDNDFNIGSNGAGTLEYSLKDGVARPTMIPDPMPGDIKYIDMNGDGVIDNFDRVNDVASPVVPEIIYGFGTNFGWKGGYINIFFQGSGNASTNLNSLANAFMPFHWGIMESNVRQEIVDSRWTEANPSQDVFFPRLRTTNMNNTNAYSTWWIRDASFLRLKNIEAGYNFTNDLLAKIHMKAARVYVMGQNIAVWDKVKVYDPELGNSAGGTKYPLPSIWTAGIELTF